MGCDWFDRVCNALDTNSMIMTKVECHQALTALLVMQTDSIEPIAEITADDLPRTRVYLVDGFRVGRVELTEGPTFFFGSRDVFDYFNRQN